MIWSFKWTLLVNVPIKAESRSPTSQRNPTCLTLDIVHTDSNPQRDQQTKKHPSSTETLQIYWFCLFSSTSPNVSRNLCRTSSSPWSRSIDSKAAPVTAPQRRINTSQELLKGKEWFDCSQPGSLLEVFDLLWHPRIWNVQETVFIGSSFKEPRTRRRLTDGQHHPTTAPSGW